MLDVFRRYYLKDKDLEYYLKNKSPLMINILTNYELIDEHFVGLDSKDSLFFI